MPDLLPALVVLSLAAGGPDRPVDHAATTRPTDLRDVVGCSHIQGLYNFTSEDFVNEGADKLLELGTRVIKLAFRDHLEGYYPFNCKWPELKSLTEVAQTPYFRKVFAKPFSTFVLMTFAPAPGDSVRYCVAGMTPADIEREKTSFRDLTRYLLTTYKGTGKTFVLQNWESDWVLTPPQTVTTNPAVQPTPVAVQGMIDWFNARQDGVEQARREVGMHWVTVAHAAEVNLVARAMEGKPTATNSVLPRTHCDLYSYSAWDTASTGPQRFRAALDYLAAKAPASDLFGRHNIYVGEVGSPERVVGSPQKQLDIMREAVQTALDWGARYVIYWQLYCNEAARKYQGRPTNDDCRGFWLIRPDGTKSLVWDYFRSLYDVQAGRGK